MPAEKEKEDIKSPKKSQAKKPKKETSWLHLESGVKRSVVGVLLLAVAMVTTLAFFGLSGSFSAGIRLSVLLENNNIQKNPLTVYKNNTSDS